MFTEHLTLGEELLDEGLVDERYRRPAGVVRGHKSSAPQECNVHHVEIIRGDREVPRPRALLRFCYRLPFYGEGDHARQTYGYVRSGCREVYTRKVCNALYARFDKGPLLGGVIIRSLRELEPSGDYLLRVKASVQLVQVVQALDHHCTAGEQYQRQGNLDPHKKAAQPARPSPGRSGTIDFLQRSTWMEVRSFKRRQEPE